ncbi:MAG: hypothetical protein QG646_1655 [Euryarchaeota archaeon]|nr:hypothetical protein [Euryarchaeota archaeon]
MFTSRIETFISILNYLKIHKLFRQSLCNFLIFLLSEKITKDGYSRVKEFNIIRGIKNYVDFLTFFT